MAVIIDGKIEHDYSDYFLSKCNLLSVYDLKRIVDGDLSLFPEQPIDMDAFNSDKSFIMEHVFEKYISRIIYHKELEVTEELLNEVLKYRKNRTWWLGISNFIGNTAIQNCFNDMVYKHLIDNYLDDEDWAYKQILMRRILNHQGLIIDEKLFNEIARLKTYWAIYELIPKMTIEQNMELYKNAHTKSFLTKPQRHELREYLSGYFKEKKVEVPNLKIER